MKKRKDNYKPWDSESEHFLGKPLTPREIEVLQLMADGIVSRGIATELNICYPTVKNHKAKIYKKLGAFDAVHAVAMGFRKGIIK